MNIDLKDDKFDGYNSSSGYYGAVSSLRDRREVNFNLKDYTKKFEEFDVYRIRLDSVRVLLIKLFFKVFFPKFKIYLRDIDGEIIQTEGREESFAFTVYFPDVSVYFIKQIQLLTHF